MFFLLLITTFTFHNRGAAVQGFVEMPSNPPRAVVLYFHRYVEKGDSIAVWAQGLTPRGYAIASFTTIPTPDPVGLANGAVAGLRMQPGLESTPLVAVGTSMGSLTAAQYFAANSDVKALVLIVPGSTQICTFLEHAKGRPVFLIQADQDEVTYGSGAEIRKCMTGNGKQLILNGASHIFPPEAVTGEIANWLDTLNFTSGN